MSGARELVLAGCDPSENALDGDVKLALAAYNAGSRHVKRYNDIPPFKETKRYLKKVFRYYEFYKERG